MELGLLQFSTKHKGTNILELRRMLAKVSNGLL